MVLLGRQLKTVLIIPDFTYGQFLIIILSNAKFASVTRITALLMICPIMYLQ